MDSSKVKVVYTIVERRDGKRFWVRIGVAFTNRDGSLNVTLDAIPTNGSLHIRDQTAADEPRRPGKPDELPRELTDEL